MEMRWGYCGFWRLGMRVLAIIFVLGLSAVKSEFYGSYDETFAEQMLNMAAAAHGHRSEVIAKCLEKTYPGRQWLVQRNTSVPCDSKQNLCRGFVAVSHLDMKLLISFRGTEGFKQFLEEIESTLTEMVFYNNVVGFGSVVRYFYNAANQIYDPLDIPLFIQWYPNYEIWITGHSLGGALATLTALKVVTSGQVSKDQVKLVTFGMPRIGDYHFARHLRFHIPNMFRVVHGSDPVAHAPACGRANDVCTANCPRLDHFPFHAPQEIWYYNLTKEMYPGNYKLCPNGQDAGEDPTCSNSVECLKRIGHAASMHLNYFNHFIPDYGRDGCVDFASGHSISAFLVAVSALLTFASIR